MKNRSEGQRHLISEEGDSDCTKSDEPILPLHQQLNNSTLHTSISAPSLFTRVQSFSSFSKFSSRNLLPQAQDGSYLRQETHCMQDIETADQDDQSTILSMSMNSLSDVNLKEPMSIVTAEVTESSSDSEDLRQVTPSAVVYTAAAPSYTSDDTTTSTARIVATKRKTTSLRRNESTSSTISSIGTFSKQKTKRKKQRRPNLIERFIKCTLTLWILLGLVYFFIYHPMQLAEIKKIPLPPSEHKVSVMILNEARPKTLQSSSLMPTLLQHPSVQEVVLLHTNPQSSFSWNHKKIVNIDASQEADEMGLSAKFYFCQLAQSDWVLFIQDNLEFQDKTLNELLVEYAKNPKRIVGKYGKDAQSGSSLYQTFYHGYSSQDAERDIEVILSQFMVMERSMCSRFFEYSHLIWEDVVVSNGEGPLWNGEDIFMSLVANHVYDHDGGKNNYAMPWLDVREVSEEVEDYRYETSKFDLNGSKYRFWDFHWWITLMNRHRHYSYREKLWKKARDRLQLIEF